jgi:hypothetical protein
MLQGSVVHARRGLVRRGRVPGRREEAVRARVGCAAGRVPGESQLALLPTSPPLTPVFLITERFHRRQLPRLLCDVRRRAGAAMGEVGRGHEGDRGTSLLFFISFAHSQSLTTSLFVLLPAWSAPF